MAARNPRYVSLFDADIGTASLTELRTALQGIRGAIPAAASAAVNKTLPRVKTRTAKDLSGYLTVGKSNLNRRLFVVKASRASLSGALKIMGRPIGLINFKTTDTRKTGVSYQIVRGGPVYEEPDAFIATGKFGNRHVFVRKGRARLPIETIFSQRLYDLVKKSPVPADLRAFIPGELKTQLRSQIDRFLAKPR